MLRPDEEVRLRLARIGIHDKFVVDWLRSEFAKEMKALPYQTDNLQRAQGRCQVFSELLDMIDSAVEEAK